MICQKRRSKNGTLTVCPAHAPARPKEVAMTSQETSQGMVTQPSAALKAYCRFDAINGLLVPGGSGNLTAGHPFYDNTEYLLQLAIEANDNGDYFPVRHSMRLISSV